MANQALSLQERVLAFQKRHDLMQDRIVGHETWGRVEDIEEGLARLEDKHNNTLDDLATCQKRGGEFDDTHGLSSVLVVSVIATAVLLIGLVLL